MPSFDIESKIDNHELSNAIDQTNRVITNRYDLKDANANVALQENEIKVTANESFQSVSYTHLTLPTILLV